MRAWKKGALIGGLWGVVSLFVAVFFGMRYEAGGFGSRSVLESMVWYFLGFHAAFSMYLLDTLGVHGNIGIILPIILGALIGSIIGYVIEKYKMRRPSK